MFLAGIEVLVEFAGRSASNIFCIGFSGDEVSIIWLTVSFKIGDVGLSDSAEIAVGIAVCDVAKAVVLVGEVLDCTGEVVVLETILVLDGVGVVGVVGLVDVDGLDSFNEDELLPKILC